MYIYTQLAVLHLSCLNSICVHSNSQLGPSLSSQIQRCEFCFMTQMSHYDLRHGRTWYFSLGSQLTSFLSMNSGLVASCQLYSWACSILFHLVVFSHNLSVKRACHLDILELEIQDAISISTVVSALEAMNGGKMCLKIDLPRLILVSNLWCQSGSFANFGEEFSVRKTLWHSVGLGWKLRMCVAGYRPVARCHTHLARCASGG